MRRLAAILCMVALLPVALAEEETSQGSYVGVSGALVLPQGGSRLDRAGGGLLRAGVCLAEDWSIEASAGQLERYTAFGANALVHFYTFDIYDRFFGYSAFDPFFTVGANGWLDGRRGQVGPSAGVGTFWHLDDNWSIRFDATATLGLDGDAEMVYSVSAGIQYSFGGL